MMDHERYTDEQLLEMVEEIDATANNVTEWESTFIEHMLSDPPHELTVKQAQTICKMAAKYLP